MNIAFTPHHKKLIRKKVQSGRYGSAAEVVREAMRLLEASDERVERIAQVQHEIEKGFHGVFTPWTGKDSRRLRNLVVKRGQKQAA